MERVRSSVDVTLPVLAIALAGGAALCLAIGQVLGFGTDALETLFLITWLLGWALLAGATLITGGYAVQLVRHTRARLPVSAVNTGLLLAALALIIVVVLLYPLWGSGSAPA